MQHIHKYLIGSFLLLVLASGKLSAQTDSTKNPINSERIGTKGRFQKGSWEFTLAGGGGSLTESTSKSSSSSSTTFFDIAFMPAYYIIDGLSIEPEIGISLIAPESGESSSGLSFLANLAYTFASPGSTVAPFIQAGYGVSNGLTIPSVSPFIYELKGSGVSMVSILNFGAGIKSVVGEHAAIRTEIFYKRQSYSDSYSGFNEAYTDGTIGIQFGISLLP